MRFYCLKCGAKIRKEIKEKEMSIDSGNTLKKRAFKEIENPEEVIKGKTKMAKSKCPDCGCVMYKILGRA